MPDCITLDLASSCCADEPVSIVLTRVDSIGDCVGGTRRPYTAAEGFGAGETATIWTGALPEDWCEISGLADATVNLFCRINPVTFEESWWIYIGGNDLGVSWYPASHPHYYQLTLISCDPFLLQIDADPPDCGESSCVWTWQAACFVAGTLVKTPTGEKPIQLLREGDIVFDINGEVVEVRSIMAGEADVLIELTDEYGVPTGVTPQHPFFALDMVSTIEAGKLVAGQRLPLGKTIASVKAFRGTFEVYNLSVTGSNTFVADGYAVHNKGQS